MFLHVAVVALGHESATQRDDCRFEFDFGGMKNLIFSRSGNGAKRGVLNPQCIQDRAGGEKPKCLNGVWWTT